MSEKEKLSPEGQKSEQLRGVVDGLSSFALAMSELSNDPVVRGLHRSQMLPGKMVDGFGTYSTKWEYVGGCMPSSELDKTELGELRIDIDDNGTKKIITLGKTPAKWNPAKGGTLIADAGEQGDFLMATANADDIESGLEATKFRYLDAQDLAEVRIENGHVFTLAENSSRNRQINSNGVIEQTSAFVF